jgi:hypothetical protein
MPLTESPDFAGPGHRDDEDYEYHEPLVNPAVRHGRVPSPGQVLGGYELQRPGATPTLTPGRLEIPMGPGDRLQAQPTVCIAASRNTLKS